MKRKIFPWLFNREFYLLFSFFLTTDFFIFCSNIFFSSDFPFVFYLSLYRVYHEFRLNLVKITTCNLMTITKSESPTPPFLLNFGEIDFLSVLQKFWACQHCRLNCFHSNINWWVQYFMNKNFFPLSCTECAKSCSFSSFFNTLVDLLSISSTF